MINNFWILPPLCFPIDHVSLSPNCNKKWEVASSLFLCTSFTRSCLFKFLMSLSTWSGEISSYGIGEVDRKWRWCWCCSWCISPPFASRATLAYLVFRGQWSSEPPAMVFYPDWKVVLPILLISFLEGLFVLYIYCFQFVLDIPFVPFIDVWYWGIVYGYMSGYIFLSTGLCNDSRFLVTFFASLLVLFVIVIWKIREWYNN